MQPAADFLHPEQHHPEEAGLEEERGQHLVGHQRPDHRAGLVGEHRPVGAELVGQHDPRDDAHREVHREDLHPVAEQIEVERLARPEPQPLEHREVAGEADGEGGKQEVEAHREGELDPREQQGVCTVEHARALLSLTPEGMPETATAVALAATGPYTAPTIE